MVTSLELRIAFTGLTLYSLGVISPNHHPAQSRKAFIGGAVKVGLVLAASLFLPKLFVYLQGITSEAAVTAVLWLYILLLSAALLALRYYGAEDRIRQWTSSEKDVDP